MNQDVFLDSNFVFSLLFLDMFKVFRRSCRLDLFFFVSLRENTVNRKTKMHLDVSAMIKQMYTYFRHDFRENVILKVS